MRRIHEFLREFFVDEQSTETWKSLELITSYTEPLLSIPPHDYISFPVIISMNPYKTCRVLLLPQIHNAVISR